MGVLIAILAIIGFTFLNVGQVIQKMGVDYWLKTQKRPSARIRRAMPWLFGQILSSVGVLLVGYAAGKGSVSVVGSLSGSGLFASSIFSYYILNERFDIRGLVLIVLGCGLVGAFASDADGGRHTHTYWLFFVVLISLLLPALAWIWTHKTRPRQAGYPIVCLSAVMGGLVPVFQALSNSDYGRGFAFIAGNSHSWVGLFNPFFVAWLAFSLASATIINLAYALERASRIVSVFTGVYSIIPIIVGVIALEETLRWASILGACMIVLGSTMLANNKSKNRISSPTHV